MADERITRDQLARAMAIRMGVGVFTLADGVDPAVARLIDEKSARRYQAVPVRIEPDGLLLVAMADPSNVFAIDDLRILTRHDIRPALASPEEIQTLLGQTSRIDAVVADLVQESGGDDVPVDQADIADASDDAPVVRLVNSLIARAVDERASDIHFEPQAKEMVVRYRVDGVLRTVTAVPFRLANGVASRVKIMADLDIAERRAPQDGRVGLTVGGRALDLRVATLPTVYGEKIVMRILDKSNVLMTLAELGFAKDVLAKFEACYRAHLRRRPGDRADRLGQVHQPLRGPQPAQLDRQEHHHGRGSGRVPPRRDQPGAGQPQGRPDVRLGAPLDPAVRPRHRDDR